MARFGRRRRGVGTGRIVMVLLAVLGGLSLVLAAANFVSLRGIYQVNRVAHAIRSAETTVDFTTGGLKERQLTPEQARAELESGLRAMGLAVSVRIRR